MNKPLSFYITRGLTFSQFGLIAVLFVIGPAIVTERYALTAAQLLGLLLGLYGIYTVGLPNFSAYPTPREGSMLITNGPFKFIRHPMYLAVLLCCAPISVYQPTIAKTITVTLLLLILLIKIVVEERLLEQRYSGYKVYKKRSWRLIPFLY